MSNTAETKRPPVVLGWMSLASIIAVMLWHFVPNFFFFLIVGFALLGGIVARKTFAGKVAILISGLVVLSSLGLLVVDKITGEPSDYVRIKEGMNMKEVEAILGGPPTDYMPAFDGFEPAPNWERDDGTIFVEFERGVVVSKSFSKRRSHWFDDLKAFVRKVLP